MDIAVEEFLLLVSSKAMYVDDEYAVLQAILSWVQHDVESRMSHLKRLLQQTHLHQISETDMNSALEVNHERSPKWPIEAKLDSKRDERLLPFDMIQCHMVKGNHLGTRAD